MGSERKRPESLSESQKQSSPGSMPSQLVVTISLRASEKSGQYLRNYCCNISKDLYGYMVQLGHVAVPGFQGGIEQNLIVSSPDSEDN
jgi:hypothetical protein